jgi:hypothetical protein
MLKLEPKKFALRTRYKRSPGMGDTLEPAEKNAKIACKNTFPPLSENALVMRFTRHGGIFRPAGSFRLLNPAPGPAFRSGRGQAIGHAGKIMPSPSVAMSSGRLFLDRDARQQSPSLLHRHAQCKTIAASNQSNYHRTVTSLLTSCLSPGAHFSRRSRVSCILFLSLLSRKVRAKEKVFAPSLAELLAET